MGFLNNTTVTVDAILTKKGRELLAQGTNAFSVTKFALADDDVDYRLWDVSHPNGSDYYGSVIESMPLLEAFPDENHVMRYKLVTLPKNTIKMPVLNVSPGSITFTEPAGMGNTGFVVAATTTNATDSSYTYILKDRTFANMTVAAAGGGAGTGATTPFYLGEDDAPNSKTLVAASVRMQVVPVVSAGSTTLIIVGNDTGATTSITITNNVTNASLAAAAMEASDIGLKENIELVGKSPSGINIYEFNYIDAAYGEGRYVGVIAQEVSDASVVMNNGYLAVDYSKIDVDFKRV